MSHNTNLLMRLVSPHMDAPTLARFAAASRNARTMSSAKQREYALLKRLVRRRKAIIKHLRGPRNNSGVRPRLAVYNFPREALIENRAEAQRRAAQSSAARAAMKRQRLFQAAIRAYTAYQQAGQNGKNAAWKRFLSTYAKSEAFRKNNNKRPINTPNNARRLMREWGYY